MGWFFQVIFFGILAALMFGVSVDFVKAKRCVTGLLFGVLELLAAAVSSGAWAYALKISGKADWFLLGIHRYTPIALICYAMFAVGVWCVAMNLWGIVKHLAAANPAAQD